MQLVVEVDNDTKKECERLLAQGYSNNAECAIAKGVPYLEPEQNNDAISRSELKKAICINEPISIDETWEQLYDAVVKAIDNAEPIPTETYIFGSGLDTYLKGYKDGRKEVNCSDCDFLKFSGKMVDVFVEIMNKYGISSLEELNQLFRGGKNEEGSLRQD